MSSYISTKQITIIVMCLNIKRLTMLLLKSTFQSNILTESALTITMTLTHTTLVALAAVAVVVAVTLVVILILIKVMPRPSSRRIWSDGGRTMAIKIIITNTSTTTTASITMTEKLNTMNAMAGLRSRSGPREKLLNQRKEMIK